MLRGTQVNYMPDKSHVIIIIINTQGQIVESHLIKYISGRQMSFKARSLPFGPRKGAF